MSQLILDLTGKQGLAPNHYGDTDMVTPQPQLRYDGVDGSMAQGTFNPFSRKGYMSPASNQKFDVTVDQALTATASITEYDDINDKVYLAERGRQLYRADGLDDLSFSRVAQFTDTSAVMHDAELYTLNDVRKMYLAYKRNAFPVAYRSYGGTYNVNSASAHADVHFEFNTTTIPSVTHTVIKKASGIASNNYTFNPSISGLGSNSAAVLFVQIRYLTTNQQSPDFTIAGSHTGISQSFGGNMNNTCATAAYQSSFYAYRIVGDSVITGSNWSFVTYDTIHDIIATVVVVKDLTNSVFNVDLTTTPPVYVDRTFDNKYQYSIGVSFSGNYGGVSLTEPPVVAGKGYETHRLSRDANGGVEAINQGEIYMSVRSYNPLPMTTIPDVAMFDPLSSTLTEKWITTLVTNNFIVPSASSNYYFLRTADNGFMYFFTQNLVHKIDGTKTGGTSGSATENVLEFPNYFSIADAVDYRGNIYIAIHENQTDSTSTTQTNFETPCGVYVWDRYSSQVSMRDYYRIEGVRQIKRIYITPEGNLRLICVSSTGITQVREASGNTFAVIQELGIGGAPQYVDALTSVGDKTVWLATDGSMYSMKDKVLARIFRMKEPSAETTAGYAQNITAGALLFGSASSSVTAGYRGDRQGILVSYTDGSTQTLKKVFPFDFSPVASTSQTVHQGDVYTLVRFFPSVSQVNYLELLMCPGGSGGSSVVGVLKVYLNQSTTPSTTVNITKDDVKFGRKYIKVGKTNAHAVQCELEFYGTLGTDSFLPSMAIVDYTATSKLK